MNYTQDTVHNEVGKGEAHFDYFIFVFDFDSEITSVGGGVCVCVCVVSVCLEKAFGAHSLLESIEKRIKVY